MAKQRQRRRRARRGHQVGTGPDSIYFHAMGRPAGGGPAAVCGHPLRPPSATPVPVDETFEELARSNPYCCPECARVLGVATTPAEPAHATGPEQEAPRWALLAAGLTAGSLGIGALARFVAAIAQRH